MLVLSRKQHQQIVIDNRIRITILKIRGNTVRIGIEAPLDVPVRRGDTPAGPGFPRPTISWTVGSPMAERVSR